MPTPYPSPFVLHANWHLVSFLCIVTRTGWDMDLFVVVIFCKKVFRTRVIRHSLNPTWDEKLLFHVRTYESAFKVQLTVLDWDKLSNNDHVGDAGVHGCGFEADAPQRDESTGLEAHGGLGMYCSIDFFEWDGCCAKYEPALTSCFYCSQTDGAKTRHQKVFSFH